MQQTARQHGVGWDRLPPIVADRACFPPPPTSIEIYVTAPDVFVIGQEETYNWIRFDRRTCTLIHNYG